MDWNFQDLNPSAVVLFSALYANYLAVNLPFNAQNLLGNVLELIGQALLAYNAQQQYFQGGGGRYYSPEWRNVSNPFCEGRQSQADDDTFNNSEQLRQLILLLRGVQRDAESFFGR